MNEEADISLHKGLALLGWESKNVAQKALEFLFTDYDFGSTTEKTSFSQFFVPEKEFFVKDPRGMLTLFEKNYKKFEEKIMLNKKVTQIKYDSKSVEVSIDESVYVSVASVEIQLLSMKQAVRILRFSTTSVGMILNSSINKNKNISEINRPKR